MTITIQQIKKVTADFFGITLVEIDGARRSRHIVRPRQIAMHCAVQLTRHSLPTIASHFGNRDHTTVMHANTKVVELIAADATIKADVDAIVSICGKLAAPQNAEDHARELAAKNKVAKSIEELEAEAQTLTGKITALNKHLAQLEKSNDPIIAVIAAINAYDDAQFGMGELQASKAVFSACHALKKFFPLDPTSQKAN